MRALFTPDSLVISRVVAASNPTSPNKVSAAFKMASRALKMIYLLLEK
jgi:hypothetical protein